MSASHKQICHAINELNYGVFDPKPITLVINGERVRHGVMDRFDTFPEYDGTFAFRAVFKENDVENYYFRSGADIRILADDAHVRI